MPTRVYLEVGKKRVFASAIEWPGWSRSGRDEDEALHKLVEYGPRYAKALGGAGRFKAPKTAGGLELVGRLQGDSTTDFGAPGKIHASDKRPLPATDLARLTSLLTACWSAFDAAVSAASGRRLQKGPRGGGRELHGIVAHVLDSERGYLGILGGKAPNANGEKALTSLRAAVLDALAASARGELPKRGPRGGARWPPRYFVRRTAWHALDHAWELEDRAR